MRPRAPSPPFDSWPQHVVVRPYGPDSDQALYVWYGLSPPRVIAHAQCDAIDLVVARSIVFTIDRIVDLSVNLDDEAHAFGFSDWTEVRDIQPEAIRYQQGKAKTNLSRIRIESNYIALKMNPFLRIATKVMGRVFAMFTGATIEILRTRAELLKSFEEAGFQPPAGLPPDLAHIQALTDATDFVNTDPN